MSITITLFQNSKLSNKYHECFVDQSSAVSYLYGLTYLQVYYGDDISEELANEFYEKLAQFVGRKIDVNLIEGGQKTYALLIVLEKY